MLLVHHVEGWAVSAGSKETKFQRHVEASLAALEETPARRVVFHTGHLPILEAGEQWAGVPTAVFTAEKGKGLHF